MMFVNFFLQETEKYIKSIRIIQNMGDEIYPESQGVTRSLTKQECAKIIITKVLRKQAPSRRVSFYEVP